MAALVGPDFRHDLVDVLAASAPSGLSAAGTAGWRTHAVSFDRGECRNSGRGRSGPYFAWSFRMRLSPSPARRTRAYPLTIQFSRVGHAVLTVGSERAAVGPAAAPSWSRRSGGDKRWAAFTVRSGSRWVARTIAVGRSLLRWSPRRSCPVTALPRVVRPRRGRWRAHFRGRGGGVGGS
jgi:hypothetical protein